VLCTEQTIPLEPVWPRPAYARFAPFPRCRWRKGIRRVAIESSTSYDDRPSSRSPCRCLPFCALEPSLARSPPWAAPAHAVLRASPLPRLQSGFLHDSYIYFRLTGGICCRRWYASEKIIAFRCSPEADSDLAARPMPSDSVVNNLPNATFSGSDAQLQAGLDL